LHSRNTVEEDFVLEVHTAIDAIPATREPTVEGVVRYAGADLLCYFADGPSSLVERQERRWGPVIAWADAALGARFHRTQGIVHQPQPQATLDRIAALAGAEDAFALTGLIAAAALFGTIPSVLIGGFSTIAVVLISTKIFRELYDADTYEPAKP